MTVQTSLVGVKDLAACRFNHGVLMSMTIYNQPTAIYLETHSSINCLLQ